MIQRVKTFIERAPSSPGLMIPLLLMLTVAMMVMPMPVLLVDLIIGFNLGVAALLMLVAIYILTPLEFSTLPGIILISTIFRLALTIATTRLILSQADAGDIVRTFGSFVIAGNIIVGLVVFLIVTLVQFIVIAKGAERVAEVGARFVLDALPGKQMSIDAELRNGDIDKVEARRRRQQLERESQLYGAMDGAMKFVKGDAIAGLIVIAVNLVGGISIGTLSRGMSIGDATREYSLLTVGDALVTQIPALLLAITAATTVTRVASERRVDLGRDIAWQILANSQALRLAAVVLVGMAFIPGFPWPVFLVLALAFGAASFVARRAPDGAVTTMPGDAEPGYAAAPSLAVAQPSLPTTVPPVALLVAPGVYAAVGGEPLTRALDSARAAVSSNLGIVIPVIAISAADQLAAGCYRIEVEGVPVEEGEVRPDWLLLRDDPAHLELLDIPLGDGNVEEVSDGDRKVWVAARHAQLLSAAGIAYDDAGQLLVAQVRGNLERYASRFMGIQETRALLGRQEAAYDELVKEVLRLIPLPRIADVLRRLLDEGIPLQQMRLVLEALAEWGEKEQNVVLLTEYVRGSLKRQICHRYANAHKVLAGYILEREAEETIRRAVRETAVGPYLVLDDKTTELLLSRVRSAFAGTAPNAMQPVILSSMDVRRFLRSFLVRNDLTVPVLSYQELASEFAVQPIGSIGIGDTPPRETETLSSGTPPPRESTDRLAAAE
jgi:type III secretion protein V